MDTKFSGSAHYVASQDLMETVNIAVALQKPLLIKGEPGTGDVIQAVRHMRTMNKQIRELVSLRDDEVYEAAKQLAMPYDLAKYVHDNGRLPVVNF